jgi:hypothetical protein
MSSVLAALAWLTLTGPVDPIDAYLDTRAAPGERVVWDNHHRRVEAARCGGARHR